PLLRRFAASWLLLVICIKGAAATLAEVGFQFALCPESPRVGIWILFAKFRSNILHALGKFECGALDAFAEAGKLMHRGLGHAFSVWRRLEGQDVAGLFAWWRVVEVTFRAGVGCSHVVDAGEK